MMKLLLLASVLPSAMTFGASGPSCACLSASVAYDEFGEEVMVETNGCVSDSPFYPACARGLSRAATRSFFPLHLILSTSLSIGCDTSDSTWGYCSDDLSGWYLDDAASMDEQGWTFTGGNVCPGGPVSVIKTNPDYVAPPEPTYFYVGPVRFEVAPATPA